MKKIILILFLVISTYNNILCHPINNLSDNIKSFGFIEIFAQVKLKDNIICNPLIQSCNKNYQLALFTMNSFLSEVPMLKASSVCIKSGDESVFITANHVCKEINNSDNFKNNKETIIKNLKSISPNIKKSEIEILFYSHIKNINEKKYKILKVIKTVNEHDLCLIKVKGKYNHVVKVAFKKPEIGDMIFNIAIPEGIQFKDSLPIFTGIFSGTYENSKSIKSYLLSIPASQGSSGSPVFNDKGEIIGIIYAAFTNFSHLSIASTIDQVKRLIR